MRMIKRSPASTVALALTSSLPRILVVGAATAIVAGGYATHTSVVPPPAAPVLAALTTHGPAITYEPPIGGQGGIGGGGEGSGEGAGEGAGGPRGDGGVGSGGYDPADGNGEAAGKPAVKGCSSPGAPGACGVQGNRQLPGGGGGGGKNEPYKM